LNCSENHLTTLEGLPEGLKNLNCSENHLTTLEGLPEGLKTLICSENHLTVLEGLPKELKMLICYGNPLVFVEPMAKRPRVEYAVPEELKILHSKDNYRRYYENYTIFTRNFYFLKTLLLIELGYPSLKVFENIKSRYYFSLKISG
jgi:Leucine-rich repeat (LRR) protein